MEDGLTQAQAAKRAGISQGHYSKLARGKVPLGGRTENALRSWLERGGAPGSADRHDEVGDLLAAIRRDCARLARLLDNTPSATDAQGRPNG